MALGGNVLRQHVVEFIRGTGIVTDGVVDATSLNGPWSWQVPDGVAELMLDGVGAGAGGGGGWNTGVSRAGGGGGGTGQVLFGARLPVTPNSSLTVSVGAAGTGGAPAALGNAGGNCTISGLLPGAIFANINQGITPSTTALWIRGGGGGYNATSGAAGGGGLPGSGTFDFGMDGSITGPANSESPGNPNSVTSAATYSAGQTGTFGVRGAPGGAASTTGTVSGGNGGLVHEGRWVMFWTGGFFGLRAAGNTDGTNSYAGGGWGGFTNFGFGGRGGAGQAVGENATGFGAGGGGGGGGAAGGNGSDGYVRFTYWSMD